MKLTLLLLMAITASTITATADQQGHLLGELWGKYEKAVSNDRPKDQLSILEEIKHRAAKEHLTFDFCDAARKYADVRSRMNWKLSDSLESRLDEELEAFGEPAAMIFASRKYRDADSLDAYIRANAEKLQASSNSALYANDYRIKSGDFGEILPDLIANDLEYALWCLHRNWNLEESSVKLIAEGLGKRYPINALYEFDVLTDDEPQEQDLDKFVQKYSGKAAALLAEHELLEKRFSDLNRTGGSSDDYIRLLSDCEDLSAKADKFSSGERMIAGICIKWNNALSERLHDSEIFADTNDGKLSVQLRNLKSVRVRIFSEDKEILDRTLDNPSGSFYALDSLSMELPVLADGSYRIRLSSGKTEREITHLQYSLSLAIKQDREGPAVYVTDYISGKPLEWCSLILRDENGNTVSEIQRLEIDGFTRIPQKMSSCFPDLKWNYTIQAKFQTAGDYARLSREFNLSPYIFKPDDNGNGDTEDDTSRCLLLTDRSAFNPGETVHFKTILYNGSHNLRLAGEGISVTAVLLDPEGNEIESAEMVTNEFSSAAGSFILKKSRLGGMYTIRIDRQGRTLTSARVLADEFVLPTFDLQWEEDTRLHLPGDTVEVKGNVKAYSGHSLSSADISYILENGTETIASGILSPDSEGNFSIKFPAPDEPEYAYCPVRVKVVDATGETREFSRTVEIQPDIPLEIIPENDTAGDFSLKDEGRLHYGRIPRYIFTDSEAAITIGTGETTKRPDAEISYRLCSGDNILEQGIMQPGKLLTGIGKYPSGLYRLNVEAKAMSDSGQEFTSKDSIFIFSLPAGTSALSVPELKSFFLENKADGLSLQMGGTSGPVWAVAELYGDGNMLLDSKQIYLTGETGETGSLETISFEHRENYPSDLSIKVFYFKDKGSFGYTREYDITDASTDLPLTFTRFMDTTLPSMQYTFVIRTEAGVECAASIFDASSETLMSDAWNKVQPWRQYHEEAYLGSICGTNGNAGIPIMLKGMVTGTARTASVSDAVEPRMNFETALEEVVVTNHIRRNFGNTLAWEPFLRSDEDGEIRLAFNTSDKLSRYHVQLFAHDKNFRNSTLRRDMTVTLPVSISVVQPQYLYESDTWNARINVSNMTDSEIRGNLCISFLDGADTGTAETMKSGDGKLSVPAGGSAGFELEVNVPKTDTLGVLIRFIPDEQEFGSDAVFVAIPVKEAVQTLTESHSALLHTGEDKKALVDELRQMFVNADGQTASVAEISIREMLLQAIPEELYPEDEDVLSLSAALWADNLLSSLDTERTSGLSEIQKAELERKITACINKDGGFGWFAGMNSSPAITAALLERFCEMGDACPSGIKDLMPSAVKYLDKEMFSSSTRPTWCGGLSLPQYLHVRAMFPSIRPDIEGTDRTILKEFRKAAREYLAPRGNVGMNGLILDKARRLSTIKALLSGRSGVSLAKELGIQFLTRQRLARTVDRDTESLAQYAEAHSSGGIYYPNAVMPWRGLLESELYAHTLLCRLMEDCGHPEIAEGIRLWIMVQKETQQWSDDPGYIEALSCVLKGSEKTLGTKVIALSADMKLPFSDIKASGNGFSIEKEFLLDGKPISDGDTLHVGDRITAVYKIWNGENRSFVKLTVPRNAALRPVLQKSGNYGWVARPIRIPGWMSFVPQGYRSVRSDRTEYWFESYPEENSSITEEFFVTQEGKFQSPVPEIESLYATHYRANGSGSGETMNVSGK